LRSQNPRKNQARKGSTINSMGGEVRVVVRAGIAVSLSGP
jgi:hypothetical protein